MARFIVKLQITTIILDEVEAESQSKAEERADRLIDEWPLSSGEEIEVLDVTRK